ncbi:hypothetical protein X771_10565 [Mesorhizobium sp. LSJC277A00]|nr:hypothetical protein X771_10565 [Mesorhizobium sp. LSJC277A00]
MSNRRIGGIATGNVASARKAFSTQATASRSSGTIVRSSFSVRMVIGLMCRAPC